MTPLEGEGEACAEHLGLSWGGGGREGGRGRRREGGREGDRGSKVGGERLCKGDEEGKVGAGGDRDGGGRG